MHANFQKATTSPFFEILFFGSVSGDALTCDMRDQEAVQTLSFTLNLRLRNERGLWTLFRLYYISSAVFLAPPYNAAFFFFKKKN